MDDKLKEPEILFQEVTRVLPVEDIRLIRMETLVKRLEEAQALTDALVERLERGSTLAILPLARQVQAKLTEARRVLD